MDISPAFITDEQTPVSMEPGKSPLDNPTVFSKTSRAAHPSSGNSVFYAPYCGSPSAKRKIISFISVKFLRTTSWTTEPSIQALLSSIFSSKRAAKSFCLLNHSMIPLRQRCHGLLYRKPLIRADFIHLYLGLLCTLCKE